MAIAIFINLFFRYPMHPPVVRFLTKIIHPNVSRHGDVGIDIIQHNWSLALTISKLLLSVQSLLTDPYTEVSSFCFILNQDLTDFFVFLHLIDLHGASTRPNV